MDVRLVKEQEFNQVMQLRDYSFESEYDEARLKDFNYWLSVSAVLGSFEQTKLAGQVVVLPLNITLRNQVFNMGGVGFVATYPEYRNQGVMKKLLSATLEQMKEDGQILSVLAPYSVSFYRYFGWELFNDVLAFNIPAARFPRLGSKRDTMRRMSFKTIDEALFQEIKNYHNRLATQKNGMMSRSDEWWNRIISKQPKGNLAAIYEEQRIVGYIRYEIANLTFKIDDFYVEHFEAEQGLWRYIVAHEASVETIIGEKSAEGQLGIHFAEPQFKKELTQQTMLRIVDVEKLFNELTWPANTDFYMEIDDQFAPWNQGLFHLTKTGAQKLQENTVVAEEKTMKISINWLAALFAGYLDIEELSYMNVVHISDEIKVIVHEIFPKQHTFFHEYF